MTRNFLVFSLLISLALSSYLPMSMKKHNFGDHICRYTDLNEQIDYVRPCETNKLCNVTETNLLGATKKNNLYTCQNYVFIPENPTTPLKDKDADCNSNAECKSILECYIDPPGTTKKCNKNCGDGVRLFPIDDGYKCRIDENKCISTKTDGSLVESDARNCKVCGEIHPNPNKKDGNNKPYQVLDSVDENDLYSQHDGKYVYEKEACESGTALYFYLDGKTKNEIDSAHSSENKMYYRCVTIKAVDPDRERFNYTDDESEKVYIYDIKEVQFDSSNKQSEMKTLCDQYLMTKVQLWNDNKVEYINYLKCPENKEADDNLKRKLYYLDHPEEYLLYKDRTEVIEYLIQRKYHDIVPIITKDSAGALKFKYLILSLMLLFL